MIYLYNLKRTFTLNRFLQFFSVVPSKIFLNTAFEVILLRSLFFQLNPKSQTVTQVLLTSQIVVTEDTFPIVRHL